jgi:hypothetical protein
MLNLFRISHVTVGLYFTLYWILRRYLQLDICSQGGNTNSQRGCSMFVSYVVGGLCVLDGGN